MMATGLAVDTQDFTAGMTSGIAARINYRKLAVFGILQAPDDVIKRLLRRFSRRQLIKQGRTQCRIRNILGSYGAHARPGVWATCADANT